MSLSEADLPRTELSGPDSSGSGGILTSLSELSSSGTICTLLSGLESLLGRLPPGGGVMGFLVCPGLRVLGRRLETVGGLG